MRVIVLALLLVGALQVSHAQEQDQTVVLISIDGFRHDYIEKYDAKNIAAIAEQGARAEGLIPVYPAKTFPNHISIVTGQYPSNHGIVDNRFFDTERQQKYQMGDGVKDSTWLTTLPIWNLAEFQGVKAATFFWPESEARINGRTASYYFNYSKPAPYEQRIDQIVQWLQLPKPARPRLVTGYFSLVDTMGHRFGPDSEQVKEAVSYLDELIGDLWQRLQNDVDAPVNLILVSDHGMTQITAAEMIDPAQLPIDNELFTVVNAQTRLLIYPNQETTEAQVNELRQQLEAMPNRQFVIESEAQLQALNVSQGPRKPSLILGVDAPASFGRGAPEEWRDGGTHGYHSHRDMDGIFIAAGPAIKQQHPLPRFQNIHIYPFMAKLLSLELLTPIDGDETVLQPLILTK
ncbi:phosphodiesterase [Pseudidiomarina atlantica]|uniref:Phosphodiesterase n=1 Tax=Pseudidiomarina atlantica TaxID=1517416 RepID=A0A094JA55_9GAMM|nr:ectonucleotide pyrophosphatase/phosphodiesterase [Pseudidiomarina atlantica]KFZ29461.1 phosphodiesterase [Pseudidiomarina atlantica]